MSRKGRKKELSQEDIDDFIKNISNDEDGLSELGTSNLAEGEDDLETDNSYTDLDSTYEPRPEEISESDEEEEIEDGV